MSEQSSPDQTLEAYIKTQITHNGPITIAHYMNLALGHPEYGYYMGRDPLGAAGDFTTAPEISQMFGELLGAWLVDSWMKLGGPKKFYLVEGGPGRGTLMADALRATKKMTEFHEASSLYMIETSPYLMERQREKLSAHSPVHVHSIDEIPNDAPILFLANELLDAFPVHQLEYRDNIWCERVVGIKEGALSIGYVPAPPPLIEHICDDLKAQVKEGDIYEIGSARETFVAKLADRVTAQNGAALLIDYGHVRSAFGDTLQAMKKHEFVPILEDSGNADLTSHVDFGALQNILSDKNIARFTVETQSDFLRTLGIIERAEALKSIATKAQQENIDSGLTRLIANDQMGDLFKIMAFASAGIDLAGLRPL